MPSINFKGKSAVWNHHLSVPYQILEKDKKLSIKGEDEDENLIIEADNLIALKSLLPKYQGRIKCIYIDPPYNTGNENWVYSDSINSPLIKDWINKTVGGDDLNRHDKWLCMMTPRLKILQELLSNDGVIFISIDDNEIHNLKALMNEIFTEANFIAELPTVMNLKGNQDEFGFAGTHEYTLVYAKNKTDSLKLGEFEIDEEGLDEWSEDEIGQWKKGANLKSTGVNAPREKRPNLFYPLYITAKDEVSIERKNKSDIKILPITDSKEMSWRWSKEKVLRETHDLIVVRDEESASIYKKQRPGLGDLPTKKPKSLFYKPEYSSGNGTAELKAIFGKKIFDNPKPVDLIMDFLRIGSNKDAIILDSFAGSGTTAQSVIELNQEDNAGNRKFILIQLQEEIKKDKEAYKEGFRYIHEITRERVKRVIERDKLSVGFSYMRLGPKIDADSMLSGSLPTYKEFAKYAYYLATGKTMDNEKTINEKNYYVGKVNGGSIYLMYEKNKEKLKSLAVTLEWAEKIHRKDNGKKIVYAPACFLDGEYLEKFNIQFVSIPYSIFEKK